MTLECPADQFVRVNGYTVRYWDEGEGAPVVLVHGLGGAAENWVYNVSPLAEHHRVIVPDLVGFGRSDKPTDAPYSLRFFAQCARDLLDALGIARASLVGNSMGGGVALRFALDFPARLDRLVLANSGAIGHELPFAMRLMTLPLMGESMALPNRISYAASLYLFVHDPSVITDEFIDAVFDLYNTPGATEAYLAVLRSGANFTNGALEVLSDELHGITAPVLVVWGEQDSTLPVRYAYRAAERIPNAQLHIFDPCGHMPQVERPAEFNELLLTFLGSDQ